MYTKAAQTGRKRKISKKGLVKKCLKLWSYLVRSGNNWTCACHGIYYPEGSRGGLDAHHIGHRGYRGVRIWWFDVRIGIPLCKGFHNFHVHCRNDEAFKVLWNDIVERYLKSKGLTLQQVRLIVESPQKKKMTEFELQIIYNQLKEKVNGRM